MFILDWYGKVFGRAKNSPCYDKLKSNEKDVKGKTHKAIAWLYHRLNSLSYKKESKEIKEATQRLKHKGIYYVTMEKKTMSPSTLISLQGIILEGLR